jgi:predicted aconitase
VLKLSERDRAMLEGERGAANAMAMRVLSRAGAIIAAPYLIDVVSAHIDGCLYHGQVSLDFVERLVEGGGKVAIPTTLNVGSLDLMHPELSPSAGDPARPSSLENEGMKAKMRSAEFSDGMP